jgi:thymidylate kinase
MSGLSGQDCYSTSKSYGISDTGMKLILIDGGPASGKNTLGALLVHKLTEPGAQYILLDLDVYVEKINPSWIWKDKQEKRKDLQKAREDFTQDINRYLQQSLSVIAIGQRFLTRDEIVDFIERLKGVRPTCYLYHLSPPFQIRKQRLEQRGPSVLIDIEKDQMERDLNPRWYGHVYENIHSPTEDAEQISRLIQNDKGLLDTVFWG